MRSNLRDYYDFAGYWQSDITYFRKKEFITVQLSSRLYDKIWSRFLYRPQQELTSHVLLLCGELFTCYKLKDEWFYDEEKLVEVIRKDEREYYKYWRSKEQYQINRSDFIDLHKQAKSPILFFTASYYGAYTANIGNSNISLKGEKDIILADIKFTQVPADKLNRDIEWFISNELREEMPMPEFSDVEKLEQRGFDKKVSFRKVK